MQGDIWAVTPATSATLLRAAASIAGAGSLVLLTNNISVAGTGYQLLITSAGNDSGITFTVRGVRVGDIKGTVVTEVITGPNATTATSTNYYTYVESISASGASAGNVSIGTTGSLAFPRTRVKSVYYVGAASAGSIKFNLNGVSGTTILQLDTPAGSASFADSLFIPAEGLLTTRSANTDFSVLVLDQVSKITVFCG